MSREQVERKFKDDLQNALFDPAAADPEVTRWINEQIDYNLPLMSSTEVDKFWIFYEKHYYNKLQRQNDCQKNLQEIHQRNTSASNSRSISRISSISDSTSLTGQVGYDTSKEQSKIDCSKRNQYNLDHFRHKSLLPTSFETPPNSGEKESFGGEILELLVGDCPDLYINRGETTKNATIAVKKINNNNQAHTIGCKVDGRIVCKVSKVIDTCLVEAARVPATQEKVQDDKFKLAAKLKCAIDDLVVSGDIKKQKAIVSNSMQVFGIQAEVCALKLIDRGLYVNDVQADLSLCRDLNAFANNMTTWIRQLKSSKKILCKSCCSIV